MENRCKVFNFSCFDRTFLLLINIHMKKMDELYKHALREIIYVHEIIAFVLRASTPPSSNSWLG